MLEKRHKVGATAHLFLIRNGKILLQRRFNTGFEDGKYSVIAGHINGGETFREAMVREAREEAGIELSIKDLEVVHLLHRKVSVEKVDTFITAKKWVGDPRITEQDKADDLRWFDLHALPENMVDYIRVVLQRIQQKQFYSEYGWS